MKRILVLLTAMVVFASCSSDDDSGDVYGEFEQIKTTLPEGEWEITNLIDGDADKTSDFESFVFTFNEDGTVVGQTDLFSENGTWAYDNSSTTEEKLVLVFGETEPFPEISDDWEIISVSSSKIELRDDNGDGDVELLTFTKL